MYRKDIIEVIRRAPCCHVLHSAYQIVVEEVNPQRTRRQASSDCYEVIKNLHFTVAASQEITDIQPSSSATGSSFVPQCIRPWVTILLRCPAVSQQPTGATSLHCGRQ